MLERKLHTIHRGTDAFVEIAVTEDGIPVGSDGVLRCDLTFERDGSTPVTFSSNDEPTWFELQHPAAVNGVDMNVIRVNLGEVPDPPAGGRWACRVTIFDDLDSHDCGTFNVEFAQQLGNAAPGQSPGGGGMGDGRFNLTDHNIIVQVQDEIPGAGANSVPHAAAYFFMHTFGSPARGTLRLYAGNGESPANGEPTQVEVDGIDYVGSLSSVEIPAGGGPGGSWGVSQIEGVIVDIPLEWSTGDPNVPASGEFEISIELLSGFAPSVDSSHGLDGTWYDPGSGNVGIRVRTSLGVFVFRIQFRDPVTLEVFAVCTLTIDEEYIFI